MGLACLASHIHLNTKAVIAKLASRFVLLSAMSALPLEQRADQAWYPVLARDDRGNVIAVEIVESKKEKI